MLAHSQYQELGKDKLEYPSFEIALNDTEVDAINKFLYYKDKMDRTKTFVDK